MVSHTVYFTKEAIYADVSEINLREREANPRRCWKEEHFILAEKSWPKGQWSFYIPDARWKLCCHLDFFGNIGGDSGGTRGIPVHALCISMHLRVYSSTLRHLWTPIKNKLSLHSQLFMDAHACLSEDWICASMFLRASRPLGVLWVLSTECWVSALVSWQMYPPARLLALTARP